MRIVHQLVQQRKFNVDYDTHERAGYTPVRPCVTKDQQHMYRLLTLCLLLLAASARADENPDERAPLAPFQIADNLYYVGSRDLAAYLVTTPKGNILINSNLASSPPLIRASIDKLGFRWSDT